MLSANGPLGRVYTLNEAAEYLRMNSRSVAKVARKSGLCSVIQAIPQKRDMLGNGRVLPPESRSFNGAYEIARLLLVKVGRRIHWYQTNRILVSKRTNKIRTRCCTRI